VVELEIVLERFGLVDSTTPYQIVEDGANLLSEQGLQQRLSRDAQVLSHVSEDGTQCADPQRLVTGNRDVMLAAPSGGQAHMTAGLARYLIAIAPKQDSQFFATEVAW
jgi:hypothetical protein